MLPDDFDIFDRTDVVEGVREGFLGHRRAEASHENFPASHFVRGVERPTESRFGRVGLPHANNSQRESYFDVGVSSNLLPFPILLLHAIPFTSLLLLIYSIIILANMIQICSTVLRTSISIGLPLALINRLTALNHPCWSMWCEVQWGLYLGRLMFFRKARTLLHSRISV